MEVDILGPFLRAKKGNIFVLMITDRYSKLSKAISVKRIGAKEVAQEFVKLGVANYRPPL